MMRIAIAGGGGLSNVLACELSQSVHALLVLSTRVRKPYPKSTQGGGDLADVLQEHPEFDEYGCQVVMVEYEDVENLRFALQGVDLVISTVGGASQINLIDAARRARVRCFVPSECKQPSVLIAPFHPGPLHRPVLPLLFSTVPPGRGVPQDMPYKRP